MDTPVRASEPIEGYPGWEICAWRWREDRQCWEIEIGNRATEEQFGEIWCKDLDDRHYLAQAFLFQSVVAVRG